MHSLVDVRFDTDLPGVYNSFCLENIFVGATQCVSIEKVSYTKGVLDRVGSAIVIVFSIYVRSFDLFG